MLAAEKICGICFREVAEIFCKIVTFVLIWNKTYFLLQCKKLCMFKTFNSDLNLSFHFPQLFILILTSCQGWITLPRSHPPGRCKHGFPLSQELQGAQEWSRVCFPFADYNALGCHWPGEKSHELVPESWDTWPAPSAFSVGPFKLKNLFIVIFIPHRHFPGAVSLILLLIWLVSIVTLICRV